VTVCDRGGRGKFGPKKCDIFLEWPPTGTDNLEHSRVQEMTQYCIIRPSSDYC